MKSLLPKLCLTATRSAVSSSRVQPLKSLAIASCRNISNTLSRSSLSHALPFTFVAACTSSFLRLPSAASSSSLLPLSHTIRHFSSSSSILTPNEAAAKAQRAAKERKLHIIFTCKKCETRSLKTMSRQAYEKGVVLIRCPGCQNLHLIADNLGYFGDNTNIEQIMREKGEQVTTLSGDVWEIGADAAHTPKIRGRD